MGNLSRKAIVILLIASYLALISCFNPWRNLGVHGRLYRLLMPSELKMGGSAPDMLYE